MRLFIITSTIAVMFGVLSVYAYYYSFIVHCDTIFYPRLGHAFLLGHSYLDLDGFPPMNMYDSSLYKGKHYPYQGPVPVLLLWLPIKLLTGAEICNQQMIFLFVAIGTCALIGFIITISRQLSSPLWAIAASVLCISFGTGLPQFLTTWMMYKVAVAGAYCFTALGILCLHRAASLRGKYSDILKMAGSLSFGLAAGCRITFIFDGLILLSVWLFQKHSKTWKAHSRELPFLLLPYGLCILGLAIYNYIRFDSIFETGFYYMILWPPLNFYHQTASPWQLKYFLENFYAYFLKPLPIERLVPWNPHFGLIEDKVADYEAYGIWVNAPFSIWPLFLLYNPRSFRSWIGNAYGLVLGIFAIAFTALMFLLFFHIHPPRYMVDFTPWIMVLAILGYQHALHLFSGGYRKTVLILGLLTAVWTTYVGLASCLHVIISTE